MGNCVLNKIKAVNQFNDDESQSYSVEGMFQLQETTEGEEMAGVGLAILDADWSAMLNQPISTTTQIPRRSCHP